jgi:hypothetical protein
MSKTNNMRRKDIRWQLLTTVSASALLLSAYGVGEAQAAGSDSDRPLLWIELGSQLDRLSDVQEPFNPPFMANITRPGFLSTLNVQSPPTFAIDEEGKISFQPEDSDWIFSAAIRYGRSQSAKHHHQQTPNAKIPVHFTLPAFLPPPFGGKYIGGYSFYPYSHVNFADGNASQSESHAVLDFQAGKDVGLGMFGSKGTSVLSAGVRIAQFTSRASATLRALPDLQYPTAPISSIFALEAFRRPAYYGVTQRIHFHAYTGIAGIRRSFQGLGPSLSWNASAPFAGNSDNGEMALDWSANAAVLFGRQKARGHHQTTTISYETAGYWTGGGNPNPKVAVGGFFGTGEKHVAPPRTSHSFNIDRTRSVTVPNVGGSIGVTYRLQDFKVSMGYRADFFFGAMDGGIDARKNENRGFFGPFASISIGLGD